MDAAAILPFIASHRLWWIVEQTLTLGPSILAIVSFMALFVALKHVNKSYAAIGVVVAITCQILFVAYYPIVMGLVYLSDQYVVATAAQRLVLVYAAEGLLAQNAAFNPLYEPVFTVSILIISLVMRKGVFPKIVAYVGIIAFAACIIGQALIPIISIGYLWYYIFVLIGFILVAWRFYRLGSSSLREAKTSQDAE